MTAHAELENYLFGLASAVKALPLDKLQDIVNVLTEARQRQAQVFIIGNGGSAATASHMVCDLGKMTIAEGLPRLRVISLADHFPLMTAWANDTSYDQVFSQQLESLANARDVLIAISTSGRSANVLRALETARAMRLTTVGLTGRDGGRLKDRVDLCIMVGSGVTSQIEDAHHVIGHMLTAALSAKAKA